MSKEAVLYYLILIGVPALALTIVLLLSRKEKKSVHGEL